MLEFKPASTENDENTEMLRVRHSKGFAEKIDRASKLLGVNKSMFARSAIEKEADDVLRQHTTFTLSQADVDAFNAALDTPPRLTSRARKAAQDFNRRIVHAD